MQLVGAGLGEDLDASETRLIVLRRKRVLVDADLADIFFGRKLAVAESINVNLPAIWAYRGTS